MTISLRQRPQRHGGSDSDNKLTLPTRLYADSTQDVTQPLCYVMLCYDTMILIRYVVVNQVYVSHRGEWITRHASFFLMPYKVQTLSIYLHIITRDSS